MSDNDCDAQNHSHLLLVCLFVREKQSGFAFIKFNMSGVTLVALQRIAPQAIQGDANTPIAERLSATEALEFAQRSCYHVGATVDMIGTFHKADGTIIIAPFQLERTADATFTARFTDRFQHLAQYRPFLDASSTLYLWPDGQPAGVFAFPDDPGMNEALGAPQSFVRAHTWTTFMFARANEVNANRMRDADNNIQQLRAQLNAAQAQIQAINSQLQHGGGAGGGASAGGGATAIGGSGRGNNNDDDTTNDNEMAAFLARVGAGSYGGGYGGGYGMPGPGTVVTAAQANAMAAGITSQTLNALRTAHIPYNEFETQMVRSGMLPTNRFEPKYAQTYPAAIAAGANVQILASALRDRLARCQFGNSTTLWTKFHAIYEKVVLDLVMRVNNAPRGAPLPQVIAMSELTIQILDSIIVELCGHATGASYLDTYDRFNREAGNPRETALQELNGGRGGRGGRGGNGGGRGGNGGNRGGGGGSRGGGGGWRGRGSGNGRGGGNDQRDL